MTDSSFLATVGDTPLVEIEGIFIKLECSNPGGSVKDRIAKFLLLEAKRRGLLREGDVVVEATSGNTGIAMTMVARELGHRAVIFMPEHMSPERRQMLERLGAEVRLTPQEESFAGAVERRDAYRGREGYYVPDQFANPDNTRCHAMTTGREIVRQLRVAGRTRADAFVAGVGTGGTLMGVAQSLREQWPDVRIVAVEPRESNVMSGGEPGDHGIMGIGDGFIPDLVDMNEVDEIACVTTDEARDEAQRLRRTHGYCVGMSAGANMLAAKRLRDARGNTRVGTVVTVWPDCADRYVSMGLEPPASQEVRCPLQSLCTERTRRMLGKAGASHDA